MGCHVKKGEKMENRVLVTPTKVCKAKGKCEYVIKFYERALCVWASYFTHTFLLHLVGFPFPLKPFSIHSEIFGTPATDFAYHWDV